MITKNFLTASDVASYLEVSVPKAYKIIQSMNAELSKKGYLTVAGKVSRVFFEEKIYSKGMVN